MKFSPEEWKKRLNWKTVLLAAVVLLIVGSLIQSVLRSFGPSGAGGGSAGKQQEAKPAQPATQPPRMVRLGNRLVPGAAGPIVALNPGLVAPGGPANLNGSGFDPGAIVDVRLQGGRGGSGQYVGTARVDKSGSFTTKFAMPETTGAAQTIVAQQRGGGTRKAAQAQIASSTGSSGTVRLNRIIGRPGDTVSMTAAGFASHERINVYWGRVSGTPLTTLTADASGGVPRASLRVGAAATGATSLVLVGQRSGVAATAPFQLMSLYPTAKLSPFAVKSAQAISLSGYGFAPNERVLAYVNTSGGAPVFATQANAAGGVSPVTFTVPFGLRGRQWLVLVGEQSRAAAQTGFMILPYSPMVRPSAYGGLPGTTLRFYVSGFAPNETVDIYAGQQGRIGTFQVNAQGKAAMAGSYTIPSNAQNSVYFRLVGRQSGGTGGASVKVGG